MSEPTGPCPVLVTCLRCGQEVDKWVVVLWQHERDRDGAVHAVHAEALAILCLRCAAVVRDAVCAAVDSATR
jgi:hypothetical protein